MSTITSRQHPLVKEFRRVARGDDTLALLDGWHLLAEAVAAGIAIKTIAVSSDALRAAESRILTHPIAATAAVVRVSPAVASALSPVKTASGIAALAERRTFSLPHLLTPPPALVVVAVDVQDPGNVGAMIRSAEAGGATGVILAGNSADPWSWKALRAAMGSTLRLPVLTNISAADTIAVLHDAAVQVIATMTRGEMSMHDADLCAATAIMIGGEGSGLPEALARRADLRVSIPMRAPVESLNAAVASALLVYEARRQREEQA